MIGVFIKALGESRIVVIAEFDARLHPLLTKAILQLFNSGHTDSKAQLLAATHDTAFNKRDSSVFPTQVILIDIAVVEERRYFLIVCEGKMTEPIYFDYWKSYLPPNLLETVEVARDIRDARAADPLKPNFDEVWAVFDKDDFPEKRFNLAVAMAQELSI